MLQIEKTIDVRFSEVDSMGIVWHGNYALYFEDAREQFGKTYGLEYLYIYKMGYFAPLVEMKLNYRKSAQYGDRVLVRCRYRETEAAKIIFDYEIVEPESGELLVSGYTVQVFLDRERKLVWQIPEFYRQWKEAHLTVKGQ